MWGAVVVIVAAGVAAYSNSLHGPFVFDDPLDSQNPSIRSLRRLEVLLPVERLDYYRPVLNLSLALCYGVGGLHVFLSCVEPGDPSGGRVDAFRLGAPDPAAVSPKTTISVRRPRPWLVAALLWMLHPLQTESVTYVVQRCEAMFGLFCLLSLYCVCARRRLAACVAVVWLCSGGLPLGWAARKRWR